MSEMSDRGWFSLPRTRLSKEQATMSEGRSIARAAVVPSGAGDSHDASNVRDQETIVKRQNLSPGPPIGGSQGRPLNQCPRRPMNQSQSLPPLS